jgi:hypothetical protein
MLRFRRERWIESREANLKLIWSCRTTPARSLDFLQAVDVLLLDSIDISRTFKSQLPTSITTLVVHTIT